MLRQAKDVAEVFENFDQKFEMCDIKQAHSRWPTRQVRKPQRQQKKGRTEPDPARETNLVVPDTRRNPEEARKNKTTGCVIPSKDVLEGPKEIENPTVVCPKTLETV